MHERQEASTNIFLEQVVGEFYKGKKLLDVVTCKNVLMLMGSCWFGLWLHEGPLGIEDTS